MALLSRRLADLFVGHSGYLSDKWEHYIAVYETELHRFLGQPVDLLEIGVQNGGSLQLWASYLPLGSRIVGVDIDPACASLTMPDNVTILIADAADPTALETLLQGRTFDVIIDDGSHQSPDIIATFQSLFNRLNFGGLYLAEDLHCSYRPAFGGGLRTSGSAIEYFKSLVEAVNFDHIEDDATLPVNESRALSRMNRSIARVAFYDSIAVVEKLGRPKTAPYRRVMTGLDTPVVNPAEAIFNMEPRVIEATALAPALADRLSSVWTGLLAAAKDELTGARLDLAAAQDRATRAEREASALSEQLDDADLRWASAQLELEAARREAAGEQGRLQRDLERQRAGSIARLKATPPTSALRMRVHELDTALTQMTYDLAVARVEAAQARHLAESLNQQRLYAETMRQSFLNSTSWKLTAPVRLLKRLVSRAADTPGEMPVPQPVPPAPPTPDPVPVPVGDPPPEPPQPLKAATLADTIDARFGYLQALRVLRIPGTHRRLTMITDSISEGSLFGGVGTAIVLAATIARKLGCSLRLATRTQPPNAGNFSTVMAAMGTPMPDNVDFVYAPVAGPDELEISDGDLFLTTSWWTTYATVQVIDPARIIYLLQEDERMFYAHGDERLKCEQTLADPRIRFVINSRLLFEHLTEGAEPLPNIKANGVYFEPAFPAFEPRPREPGGKRNFFFYARPNNLRNLYWCGLQAIGEAIEDRILDPDEWDFHFAGRDLSDLALPGGVHPILHQNLPWPDYIALIRTIDVGLSLMATPHPSYPPLDLAASGAVVVTNRYGSKVTLDRYADSIICADPTVAALKRAIAEAIARSAAPRTVNDHILRNWETALEPVVARLFPS